MLRARFALVAAMPFGAAFLLAAKDRTVPVPSVSTPNDCLEFLRGSYERARGAATAAGKKFDFAQARQRERDEARACVGKLDVSAVTGEGLLTLAQLYARGADDESAIKSTDRYIEAAADGARPKALAEAVQAIGTPTSLGNTTARINAARGYAARLDALGANAGQERIRAYNFLKHVTPDGGEQLTYFDRIVDASLDMARVGSEAERATQFSMATQMALSAWQQEPSTARESRAMKALAELESMSGTSAVDGQLSAYATAARTFAGEDREITFLEKVIATAHTAAKSGRYEKLPYATVNAYKDLATAYLLHAEKSLAEKALGRARQEIPSGDSVVASWKSELALYDLLGQPAPAIHASYWLNSSAPAGAVQLKGKVTMLEFTMPKGCGACRASYTLLPKLQKRFKEDVQVVLVTKLLGESCCGEKLTAESELNSLKIFWVNDREIRTKIAVVDPPSSPDPRHPGERIKGKAAYESDYRVNVWPTVVLVDANGIVRFVSPAFNEAQITRKLDEMVGAKVATR